MRQKSRSRIHHCWKDWRKVLFFFPLRVVCVCVCVHVRARVGRSRGQSPSHWNDLWAGWTVVGIEKSAKVSERINWVTMVKTLLSISMTIIVCTIFRDGKTPCLLQRNVTFWLSLEPKSRDVNEWENIYFLPMIRSKWMKLKSYEKSSEFYTPWTNRATLLLVISRQCCRYWCLVYRPVR